MQHQMISHQTEGDNSHACEIQFIGITRLCQLVDNKQSIYQHHIFQQYSMGIDRQGNHPLILPSHPVDSKHHYYI